MLDVDARFANKNAHRHSHDMDEYSEEAETIRARREQLI